MKNLKKFLNNDVKIEDYFEKNKVFDNQKNTKPNFSVIIPCYNSGDTLERTAASVLAQTLDNLEIIIINDCSIDEFTLKKLSKMEKYVKVIHLEKNGGLSNARNTGIQASHSDYILCLDSDDFIDERYLEKAKKIFDSKKDVSVVAPSIQTFGEIEENWIPAEDFTQIDILSRNRMPVASCVRRDIYDDVGLYDTSLKAYEDWEMWIRIFAYKKRFYRVLKGKIFFYNVRSSSMFHSMTVEKQREVLTIISTKHKKLYKDNFQDILLDLHIFTNLLDTNIRKNNEDIKILKNSKTFRLGELIFELIKKPYKVFMFPFRFLQIILSK